jgi:tRNA G10  N-methylase Trm11
METVTTLRNYQKFFTPHEVATWLVDLAEIKIGDKVLEPHGGNGRILEAIYRKFGADSKHLLLHACEVDPQWREHLMHYCSRVCIDDFLTLAYTCLYDRIIANPPFGNDTDYGKHFRKMQSLLRVGGRLVTIAPASFGLLADKDVQFYNLENWATNSDGSVTQICILVYTRA